MKFTSIFFTASENIFEVYLKDTNKRARNMKFTSIFFTASENIFEVYLKDRNKRARKPTISHPLYEVSKAITGMGSLPDG